MIDKTSKEWNEYTEEQKHLRESVEFIVSTMSDEDKRYYCYTIAHGAGFTRFHFFCTHAIFEDSSLNINEFDIAWILTGKSGICRNSKDSIYGHENGIDYAFLIFVTILNSMNIKDIIKVVYAVNGGDGIWTLEEIRDEFVGHRISDEAKELIERGETTESICNEAKEEIEEIGMQDGFRV